MQHSLALAEAYPHTIPTTPTSIARLRLRLYNHPFNVRQHLTVLPLFIRSSALFEQECCQRLTDLRCRYAIPVIVRTDNTSTTTTLQPRHSRLLLRQHSPRHEPARCLAHATLSDRWTLVEHWTISTAHYCVRPDVASSPLQSRTGRHLIQIRGNFSHPSHGRGSCDVLCLAKLEACIESNYIHFLFLLNSSMRNRRRSTLAFYRPPGTPSSD